MIFDVKPKESQKELLFRDEEVRKLTGLMEAGIWTVVMGPRMVGKTSLIKVASKGIRSVYVNLWGARGLNDLLERMLRGLSRDSVWRRVLSSVDSLSLGPLPSITLRNRSKVIGDILGELGSQGKVVVILDEVQELRSVTKPLWDLLSYTFYTYPNVSFVFTGSVSGLIRVILSPPPGSPLVGRKPVKLELAPFTENQSREFLRLGFKEAGLPVGGEIEEATSELDGIPGWLTLYGYLRLHQGLSHLDAIEQTRVEACKVLKEAFSHFLEDKRNKDLYLELIRRLPSRWSEIKRSLNVSDEVLSESLKSLQDWFFIKKINETYDVQDRMMRYCALSGLL
ncbi:AAA family ATPase [Metallosphaera hakonensis]|uniref:ATPase domain-containing protein n=1 Tax=Metallosphaera hakonensis JCM 8857 = DSM 7519 TaxID=1293036 RepID=A0A2U9IV42_9CREN|nr:ATP-binding protein [Metallosphaera hakonensis]AWR99853.1 AAA family ATPase [Metallosphaera hakonensis JCM 8857 = DSM 7519]